MSNPRPELGAFIVAYSPLGRGLLTTKWTSEADVPAGDFRKKLPRWQGEAFKANLRFAEQVKEARPRTDPLPLLCSSTRDVD